MSRHILSARGLKKDFGGFVALSGVDIDVERGSIHALIGPNGAGKTTLFNLLTKFLNPTSGSITYNGRDVTRLSPAAVAKLGMVRSFQISAVFPNMTVLENIRVALQQKAGNSYRFWERDRRIGEYDALADELIDSVGLHDFRDTVTSQLSYGRKRSLEIATTLAMDPAMMLLDEPTAGMGHEDIALVTALVKKISANRTILMVEHNLSVVASLCHRITVLARGRVLADGDYATVSRDPAVIEAYMGGSAHG